MSNRAGLFLTFEGVDGAGKSTHVERVCDVLRQSGIDVCQTREPGGTDLGEKLRDLLLNEEMHLNTETLLMFAARCEHLNALIWPALMRGQWVVCDRFSDATFAYQGGGRQLGVDRVSVLADWLHRGFAPDRTWLFDVPLDVARKRLSDSRALDRFEQEQAEFFERTRKVYLERQALEPDRFMMIDGTQSISEIANLLEKDIHTLVKRWQERL